MIDPSTDSIPQSSALGESAYNDTGNANALIEAHGNEIRYVSEWGWLVYDGTRWVKDADHLVIERAKTTIQRMFWQAGRIDDNYQRDRLLKHAKASLDYPKLQATLRAASSDSRVRAKVDDFDRDPMLFNCANGTIDLRIGDLRPHSPLDFITQLSPVPFDPEARSDIWEGFILEVANYRADLAAYLKRAMGYSLTGRTSEKGFFFAFGPSGDNGKTTLLEAVLHVMGDYGAPVSPQVILSKNGISGNAEHDAVQLVGKRYIITDEPETGQQFRMGQIKRLTGGDTMTARYHYKESFTFAPQLKLWFAANQRPAVPESNDAAWNRIKFIPFDLRVTSDKKDPKLGEKLREDAPAILAWMVAGCLEWQAHGGLQEPESMREATKDYRADQDSFQEFLDECCEASEESTRTMAVLERYRVWSSRQEGVEQLSQRSIGTRLEEHGFKTKRMSGGKVVIDLTLKPSGKSTSRWATSTGHSEDDGSEDGTDDPLHGF